MWLRSPELTPQYQKKKERFILAQGCSPWSAGPAAFGSVARQHTLVGAQGGAKLLPHSSWKQRESMSRAREPRPGRPAVASFLPPGPTSGRSHHLLMAPQAGDPAFSTLGLGEQLSKLQHDGHTLSIVCKAHFILTLTT